MSLMEENRLITTRPTAPRVETGRFPPEAWGSIEPRNVHLGHVL